MSNIGWIKLYRQITECEVLWDSSEEPFDRRSAWIDLLLMANHKDKRMIFRGKAVTVKSGQRITSLHKLAERWHWGINRVRIYLDMLQGEGMLIRESDNTKTLITIVNYQKYQGFDEFEKTPTDTVTDTVTDTPTDTVTDIAQIQSQIPNNNIYKNDKEIKNTIGDPKPFNQVLELYKEICVSFPSVRSLSESRKKSIKARLNTFTLEDFRTVFTNAEQSSFLKGKNDRNWVASFDWLLQDRNFTKVLEGQYKDRPKQTKSNTFTDIQKNDYDFAELEKQLLSKPI